MKTRAITGFFFIVVMLASVLLGHYVFGAFYLVLSVLCLREFYSLIKQAGNQPAQMAGIINSIAFYCLFAIIAADALAGYQKFVLLLTLTFAAIFIQELFKKSDA